jgi:PKHD-type hydroxylase
LKHNLQLRPNTPEYDKARAVFLARQWWDGCHTYEPVFAKYETGMYYRRHQDSPSMRGFRPKRTVVVFLNDPKEYEGGVLRITDGRRTWEFKGEQGSAVSFPIRMVHEVSTVLDGIRYVAVTWIKT